MGDCRTDGGCRSKGDWVAREAGWASGSIGHSRWEGGVLRVGRKAQLGGSYLQPASTSLPKRGGSIFYKCVIPDTCQFPYHVPRIHCRGTMYECIIASRRRRTDSTCPDLTLTLQVSINPRRAAFFASDSFYRHVIICTWNLPGGTSRIILISVGNYFDVVISIFIWLPREQPQLSTRMKRLVASVWWSNPNFVTDPKPQQVSALLLEGERQRSRLLPPKRPIKLRGIFKG